jgi:aldose sugar dehydrogenase
MRKSQSRSGIAALAVGLVGLVFVATGLSQEAPNPQGRQGAPGAAGQAAPAPARGRQAGPPAPNPRQKDFAYPVVRDMRGAVPPGPRLLPSPPLAAGPWTFQTTEASFKVSIVARGIEHPYAMAFMDDGAILVTERVGRLRVIRNGVLDPTPLPGLPPMIYRGTEAGMMDLALHPNYPQNHLVYFSYHKPIGDNLASNAVGRGRWDGKQLVDVKEIFLSDDVDTEVSRIVFGRDGMLYLTIGGPGTGPPPSLNRPQSKIDYAGKLLRMRDDGSVPPDNPFVSDKNYKPYVYAMGFRNQLGLTVNPYNGDIYAGEQGPNGGDEINVMKPGKNYGWPVVSYGRDYNGPRFPAAHADKGFEEPVVYWVPSIALSGMTFYNGDKFPNWRRNLFVGGMREGEFSPTGQLVRIVFNDKWEELRRESLLRDLHQRIRDVRQGPDGNLYVLTEENDSALLKLEPAEGSPAPQTR